MSDDILAAVLRHAADGALDRALEETMVATHSGAGVLFARDGDLVRAIHHVGLPPRVAAHLAPQALAAGAPGAEKEALRTGRTLHVARLSAHPLAGALAPRLAEESLVALLAVPLVARGEGVGTLALYAGAPFEGAATAVAERLAPAFALALAERVRGAEVAERVRRLEDEVAARTRDLDARAREMQDFLAGAGHDLKSPLVSIAGLAEALAEDATDADAVRAHAARVSANAATMDALVRDLLDLARHGRRPAVAAEVALAPLLARVAAAARPRFADAGGRVEVEGAFPTIVGDAVALERAFLNLADNALKYRAPGRPPVLRIVGERGTVLFEDNGRGFPKAFEADLFRPFRRHDPASTPGTGLGLVLVRRVVEAHGGSVAGEGREGQGATFRLRFPADA